MDTTSNNGRQQPHDQDFISHEMQVTKDAMKQTAAEIWQHVPTSDDVIAWTKANPMLAVGVAAGAGVLAGFMVAPSRGAKHPQPRRHGSEDKDSVIGSLFGAVTPALSMVANQAGRAALAAAVAHFTSQQVAEQTAEETAAETAEETVNETVSNGA